MFLCEEYNKRYSRKIPFVKILDLNFLYLKNFVNEKTDWWVYSMIIDDPARHGHGVPPVVVTKYKPILNSSLKLSNTHYNVIDTKTFLPHEYEDFIYDLAAITAKESVIVGKKEVILCAWEMFVYSNNEFIAAKYQAYFDTLFQSLDFTLSTDARYISYNYFLKLVGEKIEPFSTWKKEIEKHLLHYCNWFPDLIHD